MEIHIQNLHIENVNMAIFPRFRKFVKKVFGCGTGTGTGCNEVNSIKLVRKYNDVIGVGFHRSGWPYVFKWLTTISSNKGILFDDFIEQNFCYRDKPLVYKEPWIGVFHHPPTIPYFGNQRESLTYVFQTKEFKQSAKHLKLAIALSEHLAKFLRKHLNCPVIVIKHPAATDVPQWSIEKYRNNKNKKLIQVGYYLRNTQLISQIPTSNFSKVRLWIRKNWVEEFDRKIQKYWAVTKLRKSYGGFTNDTFVPPSQYDKLLTENIVVMEVFDASASNGILDCITRNTPIIINKHPAVVEYLGEDYPLYFKDPKDIPQIALKAEEAHKYLVNMDKSWLDVESFIKEILEKVLSV